MVAIFELYPMLKVVMNHVSESYYDKGLSDEDVEAIAQYIKNTNN